MLDYRHRISPATAALLLIFGPLLIAWFGYFGGLLAAVIAFLPVVIVAFMDEARYRSEYDQE